MSKSLLSLYTGLILDLILVGLVRAVYPEFNPVSTTEHSPESSKHDLGFNISNRLEQVELQNAQIMSTLNIVTQKLTALKKSSEELVEQYPANCVEVKERGHNVSEVYNIKPKLSPKPFPVYCNMKTMGGGWTYFFQRTDAFLNFYRNLKEYKTGFGSLKGNFWLGLEHLHHITTSEDNEMLVQMADWDGVNAYAHFDGFHVGSEDTGYALKSVGAYKGDAGDMMSGYSGMKFTTLDNDQDVRPTSNCAVDEHGAWWYTSCSGSNPTSYYLKQAKQAGYKYNLMYWYTFRGDDYSLKMMRMMVRPRQKNV